MIRSKLRTITYKCKCGHVCKKIYTDFGGESEEKTVVCEGCKKRKKRG